MISPQENRDIIIQREMAELKRIKELIKVKKLELRLLEKEYEKLYKILKDEGEI